MKKYLALALIAPLLISCSSSTKKGDSYNEAWVKDTNGFDILMGQFAHNIENLWGFKEVLIAGPKDYVKYTDQYQTRSHINFDDGTITVETIAGTDPAGHLRRAIIKTLLMGDDPGSIDLYSDVDDIKISKEPFLYGQVVDNTGQPIRWEGRATNFANYLQKATGQVIDPDSIFDCQVKRMHEYKRQHLNALNIAAEYLYLKANPNADFVPKTYIFGAKAAPGYYMAKQMIRMICKLGKLIDNDPAVKDKLRIVYLEDYCVSLSERLMPASEVSEQISLAGTEASGTGNMKFMLNGAITLGTLDGANVEIADAAGKDNEIIFGMLTPEVNALKGMGYHPQAFISDDNVAMAVLDMLEKGWNGENFSEVTNNLRNSDPYMVLADFKDYRRAQHTVQELYKQKQTWNRMSLMNISNAGIFSADRSIMDYSRDIWGTTPVK